MKSRLVFGLAGVLRCTHLCQKVVAAGCKSFVSVTLERTGCERHNNDRTLEQIQVVQAVLVLQLHGELFLGCAGDGGKDANRVYTLESANLTRGLEAVHDGQLNVHEDQMKTAGAPLLDSVATVGGRLPADLETLDKGLEQLEVNGVIFDNEDADGRYRDDAAAAGGVDILLTSLGADAGGPRLCHSRGRGVDAGGGVDVVVAGGLGHGGDGHGDYTRRHAGGI